MDLADFTTIDEDLPDSSEHGEEAQRQESQSSDLPAAEKKAAAGRIIRRRARKACVVCHKSTGHAERRPDIICCTMAILNRTRNVRIHRHSRAIQQLRHDILVLRIPGSGYAVSHCPRRLQVPRAEGCFHIPSRPILDDFVREYFLHVHPGLPIVKEREFGELYLGDQRTQGKLKKISLFLFKAMLFASCGFVSTETIKKMGFQDPSEAQSCPYRRARFLFDFNAISDSILISQGALLLTYYSSEGEGYLTNILWLRIAIHFATAENVHLYYQNTNLTPSERNVRKGLWWRPIQITRENFDFNQEPLLEADLAGEFSYSSVYDQETKRTLARILIGQMELANVLTDILSLIYPQKIFDYSTMIEMPALMRDRRTGMQSWSAKLEETSALFGSSNDSVTLFHGLTQIYYHSVLAAMYQYEALALKGNSNAKTPLRTKELGTI
ncbi:Cutinase transcription factor 1 beta, partial [Lachnellula suecica]